MDNKIVYVVHDVAECEKECAVCGSLERAKQYIVDEIRKADLSDCEITTEELIEGINDEGLDDIWWIQKTEIL